MILTLTAIKGRALVLLTMNLNLTREINQTAALTVMIGLWHNLLDEDELEGMGKVADWDGGGGGQGRNGLAQARQAVAAPAPIAWGRDFIDEPKKRFTGPIRDQLRIIQIVCLKHFSYCFQMNSWMRWCALQI
jgi:hypothetical protein